MAGRAPVESDVTYVGLLLGHGGDALQMLALANGMKERGRGSTSSCPKCRRR